MFVIVPKNPTTAVAALAEVFLVPALAVTFHRQGPSLGWSLFLAVLTLTVLWSVVWALTRNAPAPVVKVVLKSLAVNAGFTAFAPFVPMAPWLHRSAGVPKQWAGLLTFLAFLAAVFVVFVVTALIPRKGEREAARAAAAAKAASPQEAAPRKEPPTIEEMLTTFMPDADLGDHPPKQAQKQAPKQPPAPGR